jgi:antiviral helicase SLH1
MWSILGIIPCFVHLEEVANLPLATCVLGIVASIGMYKDNSNRDCRWHTLQSTPNPSWVMIVVPTKIAALGVLADLDHGSRVTQIPVQLVTETRQLFSQTTHPIIRVVPAQVLLWAFSKHLPEFRGLSMVICDTLEELDPAYELALSLLRLTTQSSSTRFVGISTSLNDHGDMAKWFGVQGPAITSFGAKDHDQSLTVSLQPFPFLIHRLFSRRWQSQHSKPYMPQLVKVLPWSLYLRVAILGQ